MVNILIETSNTLLKKYLLTLKNCINIPKLKNTKLKILLLFIYVKKNNKKRVDNIIYFNIDFFRTQENFHTYISLY